MLIGLAIIPNIEIDSTASRAGSISTVPCCKTGEGVELGIAGLSRGNSKRDGAVKCDIVSRNVYGRESKK